MFIYVNTMAQTMFQTIQNIDYDPIILCTEISCVLLQYPRQIYRRILRVVA